MSTNVTLYTVRFTEAPRKRVSLPQAIIAIRSLGGEITESTPTRVRMIQGHVGLKITGTRTAMKEVHQYLSRVERAFRSGQATLREPRAV